MRAADVMQKGVVSVSPELPLSDFEEFLTGEEISGAPVIDVRGRLLGIASKTDIIRALSEEMSGRLRELLPDSMVQDIMTRDVLAVSPDEDVQTVARRMIEERVHRVLVVDNDGVVGIITPFDMLKLIL